MKSFDGKEIVTYLWDDVKNPRGVVQLCHGMSEHLGRYDDFAKYLNANGYIVFGDDHRGFGKTDNNGGYCDGDFVGDTVKDLLLINDYLKKEYPNLPRVFFGHSYGSCLAQRFIQYDTGISACVMTGTGCAPHAVCALGVGLLALPYLLAKKAQVAFGEAANNKRFSDTDVPHAWLTKDKEIRKAYAADALSGGKATVSYFYNFVKLMRDSSKPSNMEKIKKDLPIGVFCGADDPCGQYGKMPATLVEKYKKLGINATLKLYENDRHEVLNETDKDIVYTDLLAFIDAAI